jgi:hypothetical protein
MHACTDGYVFVEDNEMSWNELYEGWKKVPIKYCPFCGMQFQPERSKREDSLIREMMESSAVDFSKLDNKPPYPLVWDKDLNFVGHKVIEEMRCSEHCGNTVRDK